MRVAVVGHVEWIDFLRVDRLPTSGEIIHAHESWEEPGGGGAVAAVQLAKLAGTASFFTALGNDDRGHRAHRELTELGLEVHAAWRSAPQRRAITSIDGRGERTIVVLGERVSPRASDPFPWSELEKADAVYFTAGDRDALRMARQARVLVATTRILPLLKEAGVRVDAVVGSASDPAERYESGDLVPAPGLVVRTEGSSGGSYEREGVTRAFPPAPVPGPVEDSYGCGDSFAAGLTYALGAGRSVEEAVEFAARCGAAVLTGRGPYRGQLASVD